MNYIWIEDMKLKIPKGGFKSTLRKNMWSTHPTYKIKVDVSNEQYESIKLLYKSSIIGFFEKRDGDTNYSIKIEDKYYVGKFDILSIQGLSKSPSKRTLQIEVGNLETNDAPKEVSRDLALSELLN